MQLTKQQQILGYFIEEAKEHLDTIERGVLNLQSTMADTESVNELFRAAHSVKGGAAMLGFSSIQKAAHHLEECFKILKDHPVKIDQKLESLFLVGFDTLKDLLEGLQSPYGFQEEAAEQAVKAAEPSFVQLETYLNSLIAGEQVDRYQSSIAAKSQAASTQKVFASAEESAAQLMTVLKQMLQIFKQGETPANRQQLIALCNRLKQLERSVGWQSLVQTVQAAIANLRNAYSTLAPVVIKELKQAYDLLQAGKAPEIMVSSNLQKLTGAAKPVAASLSREATSSKAHQTRAHQIMITAEPKAAAKALLNAFNKDQLVELADLILRAIQ